MGTMKEENSYDLPIADLLDAAIFSSDLPPCEKEKMRTLLQIPSVQDKVRQIFLKFYQIDRQ